MGILVFPAIKAFDFLAEQTAGAIAKKVLNEPEEQTPAKEAEAKPQQNASPQVPY